MWASSPTTLNRTNIVRIPYVKYSTGANRMICMTYRALRKPDQTAARRAFLTGRAIGEWHTETKCLFRRVSAISFSSASFLPILFWQDRKEWAAGGMPLLCKEKWQNSQYKKALCRSREPFARYEIGRKESIELLSVLASSFRLLLTLQAGAHIMFSLLDFSDNASLCTAALEPLESIFQGFAFLDANFRHRFPSLRRNRLDPDCFQGHSLA